MKRIIAAILFLCLSATAFAGCAKDNNTPGPAVETTTTAQTSITDVPVETDKYGRPVVECSLLSEGLNYNNEEIRILARDTHKYETYDPDSTAGDTMNNELYSRNLFVENALSVMLSFEYSVAGGQNKTYNELVRSSYSSNDPFDILLTFTYYSTPLSLEGYYANLLNEELEHLDFNKVWWNGSLNEELTLNNQLYMAVGDFSLSALKSTFAMFFNKSLLSQYHQGVNIYETVPNKTWTLAYLSSLVEQVYVDNDGVSGKSEGDTFGFITSGHANNTDPFLAGFDVGITKKNDDGTLSIALGDDKSVTAFDNVHKLFWSANSLMLESTSTVYEDVRTKFTSGKAMFIAETFGAADIIAPIMTTGYGIMPMPLYNESQKEYYSTSQEGFSALVIPSNSADLSRASAVLELLCYASYDRVVPLYYEIILTTRYVSGQEEAEIYDLILEGRKYNFGFMYSFSMENPLWSWRKQLREPTVTIKSYWDGQNGVWESGLKNILGSFGVGD